MVRHALKYTETLFMARVSPFKSKSNFARTHATLVAEAASRGHLSTEVCPGVFGDIWYLTSKGSIELDYRLHD